MREEFKRSKNFKILNLYNFRAYDKTFHLKLNTLYILDILNIL